MKAFNLDREQKSFTDYKLARLPRHWRMDAELKHAEIAKREGIKAANEWLRVLIEPLENLLNIAADDGDIKKLSEELAFKVRERMAFYAKNPSALVWDWLQELCISYGVRYPHEYDKAQQAARLIDGYWWLRNLRNAHARAREVAAINAGIVHRHKNLYVSDDTLERRGQQLRRNAETLHGIELQSESGQTMNLAEIAKAGMANPDNRRAELMTRITGFEELSIKYGHMAEFISLSCPSRMHAVLHNGKPNPKYDGTKPHEAQRYLVEVWAQVRAKLARDGLKVYGLRVAEPHHDGTPHWHLILFYNPNAKLAKGMEKIKVRDHLRQVIKTYFLRDSWSEAGAMQHRVKFVSINPLKGTAAGYIAKYVAKNIGGIEDEQSDEGSESSKSAAARVEAWAATWRIRQFQQIGGHAVSVWRELRRVGEEVAEKVPSIFGAWLAAQKKEQQKASFAQFVESMGGLDMPPRESKLKLDDDYITKRGRYGETVARVVRGVRERWGLARVVNNREKWVRV